MNDLWPIKCKDCGLETYYKTAPRKCPQCKSERIGIVFEFYTQTDSDTAGFAGYNNGLGMEIKNRGHWNQEVKKNKLRPVG